MMAINPFIHRGPFREPAYFYGRRHETRRCLNSCGKRKASPLWGRAGSIKRRFSSIWPIQWSLKRTALPPASSVLSTSIAKTAEEPQDGYLCSSTVRELSLRKDNKSWSNR